MTTAEKRKVFFEALPDYKTKAIYDCLDKEDFRWIDGYAQTIENPICLQYIITLLCDELVKITNFDNNEDVL